jgi:hypothetical protein
LSFSIPFCGSARFGKTTIQISKFSRCYIAANACALTVILAGCGGGGNEQGQWDGAVVRTQTADSLSAYLVTMSVNTPIIIDGEGIKLEALQVIDSRCPAMSLCISAGEARVALLVTPAGAAAASMNLTLTPGSPDALARHSMFMSYRITLQDVTPYPTGSAQAATENIRAIVLLEKLKSSAS